MPSCVRLLHKQRLLAFTLACCETLCFGQQQPTSIKDFIRVPAGVIAIEHVRVIDGTGAAPKTDQTILISGSKINIIGASRSVQVPPGATRLDFRGSTALPGLVGMHDHLFYPADGGLGGEIYHDMPFSFPRLYLACGVTTIRTTGAVEPYTDLEIKKAIDAGTMIGPKINVTGPYLDGPGLGLIQVHQLTGPEDARRTVEYWAAEGAGSFKAYNFITRAELKAAIEEAHKHGLTLTAHSCSIGFSEAAELNIDGLEHGLVVDTEFVAGKQSDVCPNPSYATAADMDINGERIQAMIRVLVQHHVAITSTLPVLEDFIPTRPGASPQALEAMSPEARKAYQSGRDKASTEDQNQGSKAAAGIKRWELMFRKEMEFERSFVGAGGLLLAGIDPIDGVVAGFGDQREMELLVEAGFTPLEAIKIGSLNGAQFLKEADHIGSLIAGKQADILLVQGDPSSNIRDIENVELVFKDGIGYDSKKLIESVKGQVGTR